MQSVVTFEKPLPHLTLPDWDARLYGLQVSISSIDLKCSSRPTQVAILRS